MAESNPPQEEAPAQGEDPTEAEYCAKCQKESTKDHPLNSCSKCKTTLYCTRDCRKADWKLHKKNCARLAQDRARRLTVLENRLISSGAANLPPTGPNPGAGPPIPQLHGVPVIPQLRGPPAIDSGLGQEIQTRFHYTTSDGRALAVRVQNPFQKLQERTWLIDRPVEDVYKLLVDTLRLRLYDDLIFSNATHGIPTGGELTGTAVVFLNRFIELADSLNMLPGWWDSYSVCACHIPGHPLSIWRNDFHKINIWAITAHYKDPTIGLQMRIFGEQVIGTKLVGDTLARMLEVQVILERNSPLLEYRHVPMEIEESQEGEEGEVGEGDGLDDID